MHPVRDLLIAARAVIAKPEHWTQRWFARTKDGGATFPDDPKAVCFCSMGAIAKLTAGDIKLRREAGAALGGNITSFNDTHTHAEVLAVWDRAISDLENKP